MASITLKYQKNQSQEVRIEELRISSKNGEWIVEDRNTPSFFLEEYKEAIGILNGILSLSSNGNKKKTNNGKDNDKKQAEKSINNRILFVGQRGTGKTSAMKSFADGLDKAENDGGRAFTCLPMIDPSNFDNNTNILLTVITMMFSEAKNLMSKKNDDEDVITRRENLLKRFDEVFKSLKAILGNDKPSFTLEGLNEKSLALKMHTGMHDLVKSYLDFYNKVNDPNDTNVSRLVLLIDDIDMTVSHAPEMLEQLRKYLDIENVIILMSANLAQLYNEMREHYSQAFKETLKDRNQALYIDVEDLANKYLLKLFPTSRRVRVEHSVKQLIDANLEIDDNDSSDKKLQNVILSYIWQKTRLLFIPKDASNVLHPIIPTNLRELMQFLDMLTSLEEVKYNDGDETPKLFWDKKAYESCKNNVAKFKKYFLHNWIPSHLPVEEELVFDNIPTDITEINKHLINSINVIGTKHKADLMSRQVSLDIIERNADNVFIDRDIYTMVSPNDPKFIKANKISDIFNQPSNYSYGDLLLMIDKYETYFESGDNRKFTDAIKIYYSILLFETMFFGTKEVVYEKPQEAKPELGELLIPIQQLIGGTVYYPNYFEIIEDKYFNQKGPSFDAKRAFYHKLPVDEGEMVGKGYPLFAVLYYGDIRPDRYDTTHIYDTTFENDAYIDGTDYVTFDILSILSNMLNPWHTYFRAGNRVNDVNDKESTSWKTKIEKWGHEVYTVKDGEIKRIPNSILPFYSVDMMLNYLKHSLPSKDVVGNVDYERLMDSIKSIKNVRDNNYKLFFDIGIIQAGDGHNSTSIDKKSIISELLSAIKLKDYSNVWNVSDSFDKKLKDLLNSNLNVIASEIVEKDNAIIINIQNEIKTKVDDKVLNKTTLITLFRIIGLITNNLFIISTIHECYKTHSQCPPKNGGEEIPELFRNHAMAILLNDYTVSKKDMNTLIKDLHKRTAVSEIYRHIVDSLWTNTINETLIHGIIQENVHENSSVGRYYKKLWAETAMQLKTVVPPTEQNKTNLPDISKENFEKMVDDDNMVLQKMKGVKSILIYLNLFKEAKRVFID